MYLSAKGPFDIPSLRLPQRWPETNRFHALLFPSKRRQPRRPTLPHLKGSELFETLPCESKGIVCARQVGRIGFSRSVWIQGVAHESSGIAGQSIRLSADARVEPVRVACEARCVVLEKRCVSRSPIRRTERCQRRSSRNGRLYLPLRAVARFPASTSAARRCPKRRDGENG